MDLASRVSPQRLLQRTQPRLIVAPLLHSFAVDGPTYLLRACAVDGPLGLVELETARFEFEPAEFEDTAHVPLEIVDDILVLDAQYPVGKRSLPMCHEFLILPRS
jgi:hypothetical protein